MKTLFFVLACLSSTGSVIAPVAAPAPKRVTICEALRNPPENTGVSLQVMGTYKTDGRHYEFLVDERCGRTGNSIEIGRHNDPKSYSALERQWVSECQLRGDEALCVISKEVKVTGVIRPSTTGRFLDIDSIEIADPPRADTL